MSASQRPPRRRKSSLADEHPAYPAPVPAPEEDEKQGDTAEQPEETSRVVAALPSERPTVVNPTGGGLGEARARAAARDAAWSWAKAATRLDRRVGEWSEQMAQARTAGTSPGVLREYIREAAERVGIEVDEVPREVWHAAGLTPAR